MLLLLVTPLVRPSWRPVVFAAAVAIPLVTGFARIGLGVHYLSDVVAGELLGLAWVSITAAVFRAWRRDVGLPEGPRTEVEPELAEDRPETSTG